MVVGHNPTVTARAHAWLRQRMLWWFLVVFLLHVFFFVPGLLPGHSTDRLASLRTHACTHALLPRHCGVWLTGKRPVSPGKKVVRIHQHRLPSAGLLLLLLLLQVPHCL